MAQTAHHLYSVMLEKMAVKEGIRIIALDDGPFTREAKTTLVVGIIGRRGMIEGALSFNVEVDGADATEQIVRAIKKSRFNEQIRVIVLNSIMLAGLNIVDICKVNELLNMPVIAVTRKKPHMGLLKRAIAKSQRIKKEKIELLNKIAKETALKKMNGYYVRYIGMQEVDAKKILDEGVGLLRIAHIIASGITTGESKGKV